MPIPSGPELFLRWFQLFVSIAYPVVVVALLFLAWMDFHRWVNHQIDRNDEDEHLAKEIREFIE